MSQWTHVAGILRPNFLGTIGPSEEQLKQHLVTDIPYGSEGSIKFQILDTDPPDEYGCSMARWVIVLWADLRDFGESDIPKIKAWWERITTHQSEPFYLSFRGGCLEIRVEFGNTLVLTIPNEE